MGMHEDRMRAMLFQTPEAIPISAGILPAAWMKHRDALNEVVNRHPDLFGPKRDDRDYDAVGGTYVHGRHVDVWGCVWENLHDGMESIVTGHPVPTRESVRALKAPEKDAGFPHGFMFLRLTDLRGFAEMMIDFAEEPPELRHLLDVVLEYNLRQARLRLDGMGPEPQIVYFGDDLGLQRSLPMSPETWRKHLKPCFTAIYEPFVTAGHYVYMHTDGHLLEIVDDLIDCGVRVLNPQIRANGAEGLKAHAKGKVCIDLDLDRQLFPFATPAEIEQHIVECVRILGDPKGGLWLKAEIGPDVPLENVEAICSTLEKVRGHFA